jgi:predicted DNA binding protein
MGPPFAKHISASSPNSYLMRRLVLEFSKDEFGKTGESTSQLLRNVKTMEVLQLLRQDQREITMICRVEFEDAAPKVEDYIKLLNGNDVEVQLLDCEKGGAQIAFVRLRAKSFRSTLNSQMFGSAGYLVSREIREGRIRMTFVGSIREIKLIIENVKKSGIRYRISSLTDAKFSLDSPLNELTEKQRRVLIAAYRSGYYNFPRRISSEQLAKKLDLHKSALAMHRRKAELYLLRKVLGE